MPVTQELNIAEMQKANAGWFNPNIDMNLTRAPDRFVYIFSVSKREWKVDRPPLFQKLVFRACKPGERWTMVHRLPDPIQQPIHDIEKGRQRAGDPIPGLMAASNLLNPNNVSVISMDFDPSPEVAASFNSKGCDLVSQGLFFSLNEVPTEEEISAAERRLRRMQKHLIAVCDAMPTRKELNDFLATERANVQDALAAFGETREYHKPLVATKNCPNCATSIPSSAGFHLLGTVYCVNDWQKAVAAGVKTRDDVPDEFKWWDDPVKRGPGRPPKSSGE